MTKDPECCVCDGDHGPERCLDLGCAYCVHGCPAMGPADCCETFNNQPKATT